MSKAHSGICGLHQSGPKLHFQIKRMGYYWPTMTISPKSSCGHEYILAATDYFSKWAEAVTLKEKVGEALWAYRTTYRTVTQATSYSLVYGVKAVLPLESQIPSLWIAIQEGLTIEDNVRIWLEELEALDEKRLKAQQQLECYQARMMKKFNKKVRPQSFQVGDLVLAIRRPIITIQRMGNKFMSKWDGLYVVKKVYTNDAYKLVDKDRLRISLRNRKFLKRYYP
ncbi:hypothetical protein CDL12_21109 [Handroanthus impetiginosus]|uniref:Integrase catalytic domain-containing protein n=1 Tax=Handroanthus impetiginosus TaxID=429701 RepID=A0A2G9GM07_9LAMI|nr:hypothetical protein CDL12_21109 [Handroanthus impetiginosus]